MGLTARIIDEGPELDSLREEWDALAVAASRPFCAPAWMLAWRRHVAGKGRVRVVTAVEDGRLVGIAPLWTAAGERSSRAGYQALTTDLSPPAGPIALPGREPEVAAALAGALDATRPRPSTLRLADWIGPRSMVTLLVDSWPGRRPSVHVTPALPVPIISLADTDYESWLAGRSAKFRQESRRRRRRLVEAGGSFRVARLDDLEATVDAFIELHAARWRGRGGSDALVPGLRGMLLEAGAELVPRGRLRLFTIEAGGRVVAASALLAAGGLVCGWGSGFDAEWARYAPSILLLLHALADAFERGEERMGLGPGEMSYKRRVADRQEEMAIATLVPRGGAYPLARLGLLPYQARWGVSRRLPPRVKTQLRRLRPPRGGGPS